MKQSLPILFLFFIPFFSSGQKIHFITIDQLNERVNKSNDTTYIINFWATWCTPCIKEMPALEKFEQAFKTEKVKLLLISLNFKSELNNTASFVASRKIKSEVWLLNEKDPQEYINRIDSGWSGAIPSTLLIKNRQRIFLEQDLTYDELLKQYTALK